MRLKAWIVDAPAGGCVMQILEQEGVKPELLTDGVQCKVMPELSTYKDELFLRGTEHYANFNVARNNTRTAQSVIDQLTAGLAGHAVTREPKRGDIVEVSEMAGVWSTRTLYSIEENFVFCINQYHECNFKNGGRFGVTPWSDMRPIPQPVRYSREGDIHTWTTEAE